MLMSAEEVVTNTFPTFPDFCLNIPLYSSFSFDETDLPKLVDIEFYKGHLDCYCFECKQPSVFNPEVHERYGRSFDYYAKRQNEVIERLFFCSRDNSHELNFYFRLHKKTVSKIGQNPSIADLATYEIRKYMKVLGKERYAELSRAVGLISHGVGIGSFVYLRRIIEHLIEEAHQTKVYSDGWNEEEYTRSRMDGKIEMLKSTLPDFLVTNKSIYSILSKGIHELEEQECLNSFHIVKVGIELILDEKLEELQRKDKIKQAEKEIAKLTQKLRK
jgi:hypothetical protein